MKPGNYIFHAKATSIDGIDSAEELVIPIRVIPPFYSTVWFRILASCAFFGLIIGYFKYREHTIKEKDKKEAEINHKLNELEKRALQAQMNPHFIYNSMNSIQQFMLAHDVEGAMKYLTRFSRILRTVLNMSAENRIPLSDEIKLIEDYLELENMRFPDKFDYDIKISPDINIHSIEIPPSLFNPGGKCNTSWLT
jgi:sensor histidine kinase YesM